MQAKNPTIILCERVFINHQPPDVGNLTISAKRIKSYRSHRSLL